MLFVCADHYPFSGACTGLLHNMFYEGGLIQDIGNVHVATCRYSWRESEIEKNNSVIIHRFTLCTFMSVRELISGFGNIKVKIRGIGSKFYNHIMSLNKRNASILNLSLVNEISKNLDLLCSNEKYDVIVGLAGCYEMSFASIEVAKRNNTKFILYQVDPFSTNETLSRFSYEEKLTLEKKLYTESDRIVTTPIIWNEISTVFPSELLKKTIIMEFPNVSSKVLKNKKEHSDYVSCLFAGRVYKGIRNPSYAIRLFSGLKNDRIILSLLGVTECEIHNYISRKDISSNIVFGGLVSIEKAKNAMAEADILVNIGNTMHNQVPSKLFEYISTGKPIINLCCNEDCPSQEYLKKYPLSLSIVENGDNIENQRKQLVEFIRENIGKQVDKNLVIELYKEFTPKHCAEVLSSLINSVVGEE